MAMLSPKALVGSLLVALVCFCPAVAGEFDPQAIEFFETRIRPLLVEHCRKCHGDIAKPKGGLKLTSRRAVLAGGDTGPAAVPGKPKDSLIVEAVEYRNSLQMPPDAKLTGPQIELLTKWVALGLPWPEATQPLTAHQSPQAYQLTDEQRQFWSFQPVRVTPPPSVKDASWPRSPIDRYSGRDYRLTDVSGNVVHDIIA